MEGCSSSMVAALIALVLVLPIQYFIPELTIQSQITEEPNIESAAAVSTPVLLPLKPSSTWICFLLHPLDIFFTFILLGVALMSYICDWIQRKFMERRIKKLNRYLSSCVERLQRWDVRQNQLEATLQMVQNATSEYNLLLYLLLSQRRLGSAPKPTPSNCFLEKNLDDINFQFLANPALNVFKQENL